MSYVVSNVHPTMFQNNSWACCPKLVESLLENMGGVFCILTMLVILIVFPSLWGGKPGSPDCLASMLTAQEAILDLWTYGYAQMWQSLMVCWIGRKWQLVVFGNGRFMTQAAWGYSEDVMCLQSGFSPAWCGLEKVYT